MARKLRVWVDHNVCVGNAMCETIAPKVFRLNENRQSEAVNPEGDSVEKILEAAENCPVSAIFVEDAAPGARLRAQSGALAPLRGARLDFQGAVGGHGYGRDRRRRDLSLTRPVRLNDPGYGPAAGRRHGAGLQQLVA